MRIMDRIGAVSGDNCQTRLRLTSRPELPRLMSAEIVSTILSYVVSWPMAIVVGLALFRSPISNLIERATKQRFAAYPTDRVFGPSSSH
jgi:hypothetical protein